MSGGTSSVTGGVIAWIAAEADRELPAEADFPSRRPLGEEIANELPQCPNQELIAHQFPPKAEAVESFREEWVRYEVREEVSEEEERQRRVYRGRTVGMLRRYMKYSMETGRLPSLLGKEFFRTKVTSYTVVTFEDRVIFVHDMETCLGKLDEFSRQLIARRVLQEHDCWATAKLLHCNEKTVRRMTPLVLDQLSEILLDAGLLEEVDSNTKKSCQGGLEDENSVSDCEDSENNF
jgi:hypothetical protein